MFVTKVQSHNGKKGRCLLKPNDFVLFVRKLGGICPGKTSEGFRPA
jgi:hypothetical protein